MDGTELARRLDELTGGEPPPVPAWDDLARGRAARGRRRARATLGVAGVAAASVVATGVWLGASQAAGVDVASPPGTSTPSELLGSPDGVVYLPGDPAAPTSFAAPDEGPSTDLPEYVPERVTPAQAADRCVAAVRAEVPDAAANPADIAAGEPLYVGDRIDIPLLANDSGIAGCAVVLGSGVSPATYDLTERVAADDVDTILTACASPLQIDLAGWTVSASMADGYGGIAATLVSPRQKYGVFCQLQPTGWNGFSDVSIDNRTSLADLHATSYAQSVNPNGGGGPVFNAGYSPCYPELTRCVGEGNSLTGVLPAGMESATVVFADGTEIPVPVGVHGTFAVRFVSSPGDDPHLRAFDADGAEVGTWSMRQG